MIYNNYLKTKKQKCCFYPELFVVQVLISQWSDLSGSSLDQIWITPHYTVWVNLSHMQVNPHSLIAAQCSAFRSEEHRGTLRIVLHQVWHNKSSRKPLNLKSTITKIFPAHNKKKLDIIWFWESNQCQWHEVSHCSLLVLCAISLFWCAILYM